MPVNKTVRIRIVFAFALLALVVAFGPVIGGASISKQAGLSGSVGNGPSSTTSDSNDAYSPPKQEKKEEATNPQSAIRNPQSEAPGSVVVAQSLKNDVSPPLRDIPPKPFIAGSAAPENEANTEVVNKGFVGVDPVLQTFFSPLVMPPTIVEFEGVDNVNGVAPPDTVGDVGLNHYIQWVNISFAIYTKRGDLVLGPLAGNTLWAGFGGPCEIRNAGDPIVLYDQLADRWLMSQFTLNYYPEGFHQCIAISTTGDPTGPYNRYDFLVNDEYFNDYPKLGVWPDAYYMSSVNIDNQDEWVSSYAFAFDRAKMLVGAPATFQRFTVSTAYERIIPADMDGFTPPPYGSPNYFASVDGINDLNIWEFNVDWNDPSNTTFTGPTTLNTANFDNDLCAEVRERCIPQPGSSIQLEAVNYRLMHRLAYRNFGAHESLVANHTVDANGSGRAGVRWYEIRNLNSTPAIYQQSTFSPDGTNRWMGSMAMDRKGNMALGYSASSSFTYPSIRYTGRLESDPLNTMQSEANMHTGTGSQTGNSRWGDYSAMTVDPVDDCTFWYTNEYLQTTGYNWQTRVGSFKFPDCKPASCGPGTDYLVSSEYNALVGGSTLVPGTQCDDCTTLIPLPFPVDLYGETYSQARISSNGNLQFTGNSASFGNVCLPYNVMGATIFPLWDNLDMRSSITTTFTPGVYTSTITVGGIPAFVIEWDACLYNNGACNRGRAHFTLRLYEGHDKFDVIYATMADRGASATIGVQNADRTQSTVFSCGAPSAYALLKLTFRTRPCSGGCDADYSIDRITSGFAGAITLVPGSQCDNCLVTIPFPITYNFYGESVTSAQVSSNGSLSFTGGVTSGINECLPVTYFDNALFPFWDNLDMTLGITNTFTPGIYTATTGTAPNRVFYIEWRACFENSGSCNLGKVNFEALFYEGQDRFDFLYNILGSTLARSATIGVQRDTGTQWTSFSCNADTLAPGDRLIFFLLSGDTATDSITTSDPEMVGRLTRDGTASVCATPKVCPGLYLNDFSGHHYKAYAYTNNSTLAQCVTVDLIDDCAGSGEIFSAAYLGSFNPVDLCENYLADEGVSGPTGSYSFNVPAGADYVIVVHEVTPDTGCTNYSLKVNSVDCNPRATPTIIPTPTCIPGRTYNQSSNLGIADSGTVTSTLSIPDNFFISTIEVTGVVISHTNPADLDVFLVSPWGTSVQLFADACGSTDWTNANTNFNLADNKGFVIGATCPPGTDHYRPEGALNAILGQSALGTWSLRISDDAALNAGLLDNWGLRFGAGNCTPLTPVATDTPIYTVTHTPTRTPMNTSTRTATNSPTPTNTPILVGHVNWQGRPAQPNGLQRLPITLTLKLGATEINYPVDTTDPHGFFTVTVSGLPRATYNWRVKGPDGAPKALLTDPTGFLSNCGIVTLVGAPQTNVEMGQMRAGDANNDDIASIVDFNILKVTFALAVGDVGYDNRADFNGDSLANIQDFNLLKNSFGLGGCVASFQ